MNGSGGSAGRFATPEDFRVEEVPLYEPSGEGGHTFLWVEKRDRNTEDVARWLAREAGVRVADVGYAGRKDRFAVALQHFSVPDLDPERAAALAMEGVRVLRALRHPHKLRTGQLAANRFDLCVRGLAAATARGVDAAASRIRAQGLPNRFGGQRFGRDGENAERGRRLLAGGPLRGDRRQARFLVSALQSAVFNEALAARPLPLDVVEVGDLARRTDSGGLFLVEDEETENARARRFEISATGPVFGTRMERPGETVLERERAAARAFGVDLDEVSPPRGLRMRGGRRPLRVPALDLAIAKDPAVEEGILQLHVTLPAGSFVTVLLEELLGGVPERVSSRG